MKILVVDDDKKVGDFLRTSLQAEYFAVDVVEDGEEALTLARLNNYDLISLDWNLPKLSGREVCATLRAEGQTAPILVLSVRTDTASKAEILNAGADDFLSKPFSFEELLARVRALLRRPRQIEDDTLEAGPVRLDTKKVVATCNGKEIYLTRKEFMLLEYLMRNKGSVVSRGMIMEHVWDMNADPFSNTIESHILSLRRKLSQTNKKKLIHTIPGRGYKIE